jgi:hypothetical protein
MPDIEPPGWLKSWIAACLNSTVYVGVGVSMGAILYLIAPHYGGQPWAWFFVGTCIPPGPMHLVATSDWMFRRRLRNLKRLLDEGLLSEELYEQDRKRATEWRADRLYGKAPALPSKPKPGASKRTKPAITSKATESAPAAESQPGVQTGTT